MRVIVCGPRDFDEYDTICDAIEESGFDITEIVSGSAKGVDTLGEQWATDNDIPFVIFKPDWNNVNKAGAKIKTNDWGKVYNANAGFDRNAEMVDYADACIAIDTGSAGTGSTIKLSKEANIPLFVYDVNANKPDEDYKYHF